LFLAYVLLLCASFFALAMRESMATTTVTVQAGGIVFDEDDTGRDVFIVLSGRLEVVGSDSAARIAWIGQHGVVGERAMLDGGRRCATVRALRDSELLRIPGPAMERLFERHPIVLRRMSTTVAERVQVRSGAVAPGATGIAVIAAGSTERWRVHAFCQQLSEHLGAVGATTVLDHSSSTTGRSLDLIEAAHRFVIYEGSGPRSDWTRRCARQADRVLLLADAAADAHVSRDERRLLESTVRPGVSRELVLLHAGSTPSPGTSLWLEDRRLDGWYHVTGEEVSLERLARHLSGEAVGLVLGGGGARGLAHLGVLRALEHSEVPIDAVGGTSIGAIMGAFAALGWSDERRMAVARASFVETRRLVGYTLPVLSLSSSKKLTRLLRHHLGEVAIEDLPVPFFCIS